MKSNVISDNFWGTLLAYENLPKEVQVAALLRTEKTVLSQCP